MDPEAEPKQSLDKLSALIAMKLKRGPDGRLSEHDQDLVDSIFTDVNTVAFPKNLTDEGLASQVSPMTPEAMSQLVKERPVDFEKFHEALRKVHIPGHPELKAFVGGGTFFGVDATDGHPLFYNEVPEGKVYEYVPNCTPWLVTNVLVHASLEQSGMDTSLANPESSKRINQLAVKEGPVPYHMGMLKVRMPIGEDGSSTEVVVGSSSAEITPEALAYLETKLRPESLDNDKDFGTHFTGAGFFDEVAILLLEAYANGASDEKLQDIFEAEWALYIARDEEGPLSSTHN